MKKRFLAVLLTVVLAAGGLTACGGKSDGGNAKADGEATESEEAELSEAEKLCQEARKRLIEGDMAQYEELMNQAIAAGYSTDAYREMAIEFGANRRKDGELIVERDEAKSFEYLKKSAECGNWMSTVDYAYACVDACWTDVWLEPSRTYSRYFYSFDVAVSEEETKSAIRMMYDCLLEKSAEDQDAKLQLAFCLYAGSFSDEANTQQVFYRAGIMSLEQAKADSQALLEESLSAKNGQAVELLMEITMWQNEKAGVRYDSEAMMAICDKAEAADVPNVDVLRGIIYLQYDRDPVKALEYFEKADQEGNLYGTFYAGYCLDDSLDIRLIKAYPSNYDIEGRALQAKAYYEKALAACTDDKNYGQKQIKLASLYALAHLYMEGRGSAISVDESKANEYLELAEEVERIHADDRTGEDLSLSREYNYIKDIVEEKDIYASTYEAASYLFESDGSEYDLLEAARRGNVYAMSTLARKKYSTDPETALYWWTEACEKGSVVAAQNISAFYYSYGGADYVDAEKFVKYSMMAIDNYTDHAPILEECYFALSSASSCGYILASTFAEGTEFVNGDRIEKDHELAKRYYELVIAMNPDCREKYPNIDAELEKVSH